MLIKLKTCKNPKTENDYFYINPKYIVAIYYNSQNRKTAIETVNTVNTSFENSPFYVENTVAEIMKEMCSVKEKTKNDD